MTSSLDDLKVNLRNSISSVFTPNSAKSWGDPLPMSKVLKEIRKRYDNPIPVLNQRRIEMAFERFYRTGEISTVADLKHLCSGVGGVHSKRCLFLDPPNLQAILRRVGNEEERRRRECFRRLLRSYWSFERNNTETTSAAERGWSQLREWLRKNLDRIGSKSGLTPRWLLTLDEHRNLLGEEPCRRYGEDLLSGEKACVAKVFEDLAIPANSWLREECVLAQIQASVALPDEKFRRSLSRTLDLTNGQDSFKLPPSLQTRSIALLVSRYSKCASTPEDARLLHAALSAIGNPWLHRNKWDAHVRDESGRPDESAWKMVNGWLKVQLITDFFVLLSESGSVDRRRLNYWLRFELAITEMWFALGADALNDRRQEYVDFRRRASGRLLELSGVTPPQNNAFLMKMGENMVIEFGLTGNACFVYRWNKLRPGLLKQLDGSTHRPSVDIADLRDANFEARLIHRDTKVELWEDKFDSKLPPIVGFRPTSSRTSPIPPPKANTNNTAEVLFSRLEFEKHVARFHLKIFDYHKVGGALWVQIDNADPEICGPLRAWGFQYKPGKGWWKE